MIIRICIEGQEYLAALIPQSLDIDEIVEAQAELSNALPYVDLPQRQTAQTLLSSFDFLPQPDVIEAANAYMSKQPTYHISITK